MGAFFALGAFFPFVALGLAGARLRGAAAAGAGAGTVGAVGAAVAAVSDPGSGRASKVTSTGRVLRRPAIISSGSVKHVRARGGGRCGILCCVSVCACCCAPAFN